MIVKATFFLLFSPFKLISEPIPGWVYILILHMMVQVLSNSQGFFKGHRVESHLKRETMSIRRITIFPLFLFSCSVLSDSLQSHGLQHTRLPCPSPSPGVCSNSCPLSRWCHPTISSLLSPSSPAFNPSQHQGLFQRVSSLHQVAKVLELQLQHQSFWWIFRTDFL